MAVLISSHMLVVDGVGTKVRPFSSSVISVVFSLKFSERFTIMFELLFSFSFVVFSILLSLLISIVDFMSFSVHGGIVLGCG